MQQLESLRGDFNALRGAAGCVTSGAVEARHEAEFDRIGSRHEDDGDRLGRSLGVRAAICRVRDDHGHLPANKVGKECPPPLDLPLCPPVFDRDAATLDKARLRQTLRKRRHLVSHRFERLAMEKPDDGQRPLLRPCHRRPRRSAAYPRDELPSSHQSCPDLI
jgi:hypothetical protein